MSKPISRVERIGRAREALKAAELHRTAGEYRDACARAKVAVFEYLDGGSNSSTEEWARFNRITPMARRSDSGVVRTVYTSDADLTDEDAAFCVEFAAGVCSG
jgi:hypothetical protein